MNRFRSGKSIQKDHYLLLMKLVGIFNAYASRQHSHWTTELNRLRHDGYSFIFITQDINFIPAPVHALGSEFIYLRSFTKNSTHYWVLNQLTRKSPYQEKRLFNYNKKYFNFYKSAEVHNKKVSLPKALKTVIILSGGLDCVSLIYCISL